MTISRAAKERHLVAALSALNDADFEVIDRLVFAMLKLENERRAALVNAGLDELRDSTPIVHRRAADWPGIFDLGGEGGPE